MKSKICDILNFFFFFAGVERLKITIQYVGCKQSQGGIVPENSCDMQMPRDKADAAMKKDLSIIHRATEEVFKFCCIFR